MSTRLEKRSWLIPGPFLFELIATEKLPFDKYGIGWIGLKVCIPVIDAEAYELVAQKQLEYGGHHGAFSCFILLYNIRSSNGAVSGRNEYLPVELPEAIKDFKKVL